MSTLTRWPLSSHQLGVWAAHQLSVDSLYYTASLALQLTGRLDAGALASAVDALVDRHEQLRTRFVAVDGAPFQIVENRDPSGQVLNLVAAADEAAAAAHVDRVRVQPFDLSGGPLFRAVLVRVTPEDHVLVLAAHHIVIDGASFGILCGDLSVLYGAALVGAPSPLPDLPSRYVDYSVWQQDRDDPTAQAQHLAYWRETLRTAAVDGSLYRTVRSAPRHLARLDVRIPSTALDAASALARAESTTLSTVMLAMFARTIVLHGHTDEVLVSLPLSFRRSPELQQIVGLFVDAVPVRLRADPHEDAVRTVRRARDAVASAIVHAGAPPERVLAEIHPERLASAEPMAPYGFQIFARGRQRTLQLPGVRARPLPPVAPDTLRDLELQLNQLGELTGTLTYADDIFSPADAELFRHRLVWMAARLSPAGAGAMPGQPAVLTGPDRRPLPGGTVVERFVEVARRQPSAAAIRTDDRAVSYRELAERTAALALELRNRGVSRSDVVAICAERGLDLVVAVFAVWRVGGVHVRIDPNLPSARQATLLRDSGAVALIRGHRAPRGGVQVLSGDAVVELDQVRRTPSDDPMPDVPLDAAFPAYISHSEETSGEWHTRVCHHGGLLNFASWLTGQLALGPADRLACLSAVGDDAILGEIVPSILSGACLEISTGRHYVQPVRLVRWLRERTVTVAVLPAPLAHEAGVAGLADVPSLRCLAFRGGRLTSWPRSRPGLRLVNLYGVAAASVVSTAAELDEPGDRLPPIGRPIDHTCVTVLDRRGEVCGANVAGSLSISGAGVALGYLGRPRLTAERFTPDPCGAPGARRYVTGDVVRMTVDGQLEFLGRTSGWLATEVVLLRHDGIRAARVVARREPPPRRDSLVAYYVPAGRPVPQAELRHQLREVLRSSALPDHFVELAELPYTDAGTVDAAALPVPNQVRLDEGPPDAGQHARERQLCEVWQRVLDVPAVTPNDSFFDLGGTSLAAVRLLSRLQQDGTDLPVHALYSHPTPRAFARLVERMHNWQPAAYVDMAGVIRQDRELVDNRGTFPVRIDHPRAPALGGIVLVGGTHLVDLDGRTFNARPLRDVAEGLASHGWTVVRFDQGFQMPALWPWLSPVEYVEAMHDRIAACRRHLAGLKPGAPVVAVGHSLGAALVMTLWHTVDLAGLVSLSSPPRDLREAVAPFAGPGDPARYARAEWPWVAGLPTLALCGIRDPRTTPHIQERWEGLAAGHASLTVAFGDWDHWGLGSVLDSLGWNHVSGELVARLARWLDDLRTARS